MNLQEIGLKYNTDKATWHGYLNFYEKYLNHLKDSSFNMLEIGILNEGSTKTWLEYFPNSTVHAIDVEYITSYNSRGIYYKISQDDSRLKTKFKNEFFKIILDDGSHKVKHQLKSLSFLWDKLAYGGYYIVEDIHSSFHSDYIDFSPTTFSVLRNLEIGNIAGNLVIDDTELNLKKIKEEMEFINFYIKNSSDLKDSQTCIIKKKNK